MFFPTRHFAFADTPPAGGAGGDPPSSSPPVRDANAYSAPVTVPPMESASLAGTVPPVEVAPPAESVSQEPESPPLSLDMPAMVRDRDGNIVTKTLGEIVEGWRSSPTSEDRENFDLFKRAVSTGPDSMAAATELMQKLSPGVPTAAPGGTPVVGAPPLQESEVLGKLTERLAVLEETFSKRVNPMLGQVDFASRLNQVKAGFQASPDKYPLLGRLQQGTSMVIAQENIYRNKVKAEGLNYDTLPPEVRQKILVRSMEDVEQHLGVLQKELGGVASPRESLPNVVSVNDQVPDISSGHRPPKVRLDDYGNLVTEQPPTSLPATPVTPPTGTMVGAESPQEKGPLTQGALREVMRRRTTTVSSPG